MHLIARPGPLATRTAPATIWPMLVLALVALWVTGGACMTDDEITALRKDTQDLFYHGYDNYMSHAFPEDELKPIACQPQTRNRSNPADIGLNDVLGNFTLTLIDSLSTLAILASGERDKKDKRDPLRDFQDGVKSIVELYGDGTDKKPCGTRACAFDLDSKVQVFETNIRGLGGLLSAHLFAIGELPIKGYKPVFKNGKNPGIRWKNGFTYNNQLLHLAHDLGNRLTPAFSTITGIPYPRVNLRTGIPFYQDAEHGVCRIDGTSVNSREITENCAAGAGSLVLEFSALSRMTGDERFERLAKQAFFAIWEARSSIGLLGNGIDAENGQWTVPTLSGIGAGIDSFFEYSIKSAILLSNLPYNASNYKTEAPEVFLQIWDEAHAAVKRHIYRDARSEKYPYYSQVDFNSGASRYNWIDNLSAYYPGLLVLAGELDEAIEGHLLWTALWTRYQALPERWNTPNAYIDDNFKHWPGRPEFIESTFYLFQATKDPYYLHVGEMALRDIRQRCWTKCGWAALADVRNGKQGDRMESFFLGETAKYLYLLFNQDHPLNRLDRPVVFSTEGHPLIIPRQYHKVVPFDAPVKQQIRQLEAMPGSTHNATCPAPLPLLPLTVSNVVTRKDFFHAAVMAQLHAVPIHPVSSALIEASPNSPGISLADVGSPTNHTYYPRTLPQYLRPVEGTSSPMLNSVSSTLTFPNLGNTPGEENGHIPLGALLKIQDGLLVHSLSNVRFNMVQEPKGFALSDAQGRVTIDIPGMEFRISAVGNLALGKDERVVLSNRALNGINPTDQHFTKKKDLEMVDLLVDVPVLGKDEADQTPFRIEEPENGTLGEKIRGKLADIITSLSLTAEPTALAKAAGNPNVVRHLVPAILPTGIGAAPLASLHDESTSMTAFGSLPHKSIFYLTDTLCAHDIPMGIAMHYNILVIQRGGCSFNDKLAHIPSFAPREDRLQLVIVVSTPSSSASDQQSNREGLIRPLLDKLQLTPTGTERRNPIAMVMVDGSPENVAALMGAANALGSFAEQDDEEDTKGRKAKLVEAQRSVETANGKVSTGAGLGVKRRYWFESDNLVIQNLHMI
ncbi:glycoside hydrolase family 47 protein [Dothistroma septosporum NZE10]|uniref:alpha-1,2-Mannosidase n=1 Tax=Dothistroma septosporum (strain NZE10 / CBS 128990) TaxID=675120 RepID=N1PTV9_DOTSN|nr:glycoside hydrolase family 47 protein [Dothistroma septosporum NZE10]